MLQHVRTWARATRRDLVAISTAIRDPRTPWTARLLGAAVIAYAASPIDLIPDFVPVLGYLDDVLIVPAGLILVRRMIPPPVLAEHRRLAEERPLRLRSRWGAAFIVGVWLAIVLLVALRFL